MKVIEKPRCRISPFARKGGGESVKVSLHVSFKLPALFLAAVFMAAGVDGASAFQLKAGPMVGGGGMRSALIWLQGDSAAQVQVEYWNVSHPDGKQRSAPIGLSPDGDYTAKIEIDKLEPGQTYNYGVLVNGKPLSSDQPLQLRTLPLWQWRTDPPDFTLLTGSCAYINEEAYDRPGKPYGDGYAIFTTMAQMHPDLTLWMGDNLYFREADYGSRWGMHYRYAHDRALKELQPLLRTGRHFAIWDDHDYGPNDSNKSFILKDESLALFKRYWANPSFGLPELPGVFTVVSYGDADLFLLDDRYYRDSDTLPDSADKAMFGLRQLAWLEDALLNSTATFKIIVAGGQMLNDFDAFEGWNHFPAERNAFLAWLAKAKIQGVLFLSGDRHHTELLRIERPNGYPLYELTCSPLTAGSHDISGERNKPILVPGTLVGEHNFCSMKFEGVADQRRIVLRSFDAAGKELWHHEINASELK